MREYIEYDFGPMKLKLADLIFFSSIMSDMSAKQPRRQKKGASNSGATTPATPALASTPVETSKVNVWHFLFLVIHFVHFNLSLQLEALDIPSCRPRLEAAARRPKLGGGGAGQLGGARCEH